MRLGTPAATSRGFGTAEFTMVGEMIIEVLNGLEQNGEDGNAEIEKAVKAKVLTLTGDFPIYS